MVENNLPGQESTAMCQSTLFTGVQRLINRFKSSSSSSPSENCSSTTMNPDTLTYSTDKANSGFSNEMDKQLKLTANQEKDPMLIKNGPGGGSETFTGLVIDKATGDPPKDKYNMIYWFLIIHGIGILLPWNMFINAGAYFTDYKLNVNLSDTEENESLQNIRENFLNYVGFSSQAPNLICNALNLFIQSQAGNLTFRITVCLLLQSILIVLNIILAVVDSSSWPFVFFYITLSSIIIIYSCTGVYQNCIYGVAGKLPMKYSNAVVLGSNICGTLISLLNILSLVITPNLRIAAVFYFTLALLILIVCFITYYAFNLSPFYRYYEDQDIARDAARIEAIPYLKIFKQIWVQCLNVFLVFFVTLALFPNVLAGVSSYDNLFGISDEYFLPVLCFLLFNSTAMLGNLIPEYLPNIPGPGTLWIYTVARIGFIPFFILCNFNAQVRVWPVVFKSDFFYFLGVIALGLTQGHASSLGMMYTPHLAESQYAGQAGMMAAFFLVFGIFCGVNFSFLLTWIVKQPWFS